MLQFETLEQEVVVIELVVVLHDLALDLGRVDPCHKVLKVTGDKEGRVRHGVWSDPDVPLVEAPREQGFSISITS